MVEVIRTFAMTATAAPTVKDQELASFGLVESASVNSINDFIPSNLKESEIPSEKCDFVNTFICHLIFYMIFCVSLVMHILIDLGLGSFIKNKFVQLMGPGSHNSDQKRPAFA